MKSTKTQVTPSASDSRYLSAIVLSWYLHGSGCSMASHACDMERKCTATGSRPPVEMWPGRDSAILTSQICHGFEDLSTCYNRRTWMLKKWWKKSSKQPILWSSPILWGKQRQYSRGLRSRSHATGGTPTVQSARFSRSWSAWFPPPVCVASHPRFDMARSRILPAPGDCWDQELNKSIRVLQVACPRQSSMTCGLNQFANDFTSDNSYALKNPTLRLTCFERSGHLLWIHFSSLQPSSLLSSVISGAFILQLLLLQRQDNLSMTHPTWGENP